MVNIKILKTLIFERPVYMCLYFRRSYDDEYRLTYTVRGDEAISCKKRARRRDDETPSGWRARRPLETELRDPRSSGSSGGGADWCAA